MQLECRSFSYGYPGSEPVFRDLDFSMTGPGFHALFGPSGVGKTTLARLLAKDISGYSGEISLSGVEKTAYSYNLERLPGWSSIGKHLDRIIPESRKSQMEELISIFSLEECLNRRFPQLSLGQKNRVNLLRYLLQDFDLLIMDESLANVDEITRERIILKIKEMFPQMFFLYISHNVVEVSKFCGEILVFRGVRRHPQAVMVKGQDIYNETQLNASALDRTLLEIMNAA